MCWILLLQILKLVADQLDAPLLTVASYFDSIYGVRQKQRKFDETERNRNCKCAGLHLIKQQIQELHWNSNTEFQVNWTIIISCTDKL